MKLTDKQLKMQRDMLRTELAKSLEHKKKTDQYNMEAKQYAQRVSRDVCMCIFLFVCTCMCLCICLSRMSVCLSVIRLVSVCLSFYVVC